jgi:hypothetical protein
MERAHKVISDWRPDWPIAAIGDATKLIQILVRALTAYGDQRAREAEAAMRDKLLDHADACVREARAAAIEAAAQAIPDNYKFSDYPELQSSARHGVDVFRRMIRALATASPQSEGGEG